MPILVNGFDVVYANAWRGVVVKSSASCDGGLEPDLTDLAPLRAHPMKSLKTITTAGTVTAGDTSQKIAEVNPKRGLLMLLNPDGEEGHLHYNFGDDAELGATMSLAPGQWVKFDERCGVPGESVHVTASDTDHAFVLLLGQQANIE
jgi:hypothetical protein